MKDIAIDVLTENIVESGTKEYFREVENTFRNGNNRSCLVILYSVVICDLLFKVKTLDEVYNDPKAHDIIKIIKQLQTANQRSAEWETKLVDLINEKTEFLEIHEYENIKQLQRHRHLSAHPVLVNDITLFTPSNDQVRSHVRNALEGVLVKPAIFSKNIFTNILSDLETIKSVLTNDQELDKYMNSKYLKGLSQSLYNDIFKRLWKLTYVLVNDKCNENRQINERFVTLMYLKRKKPILQYISNNPRSFSTLPDYNQIFDDQNLFERLLSLLFKGGYKLFNAFPEEVKVIVRKIMEDYEGHYKVFGIFMFSDIGNIEENINESINSGDNPDPNLLKKLNFLQWIEDNFGKQFKRKFALKVYSNSNSFNNTKKYQKYLIEPFVDEMTEDELKSIIQAMNDNYQIRARFNNSWFQRRVVERHNEISFSPLDDGSYPNLVL